jgi:hypothetical protein
MVYCKKSMHNSLVAWYFDKMYMPNIAYVVGMLSRFTHNPSVEYCDAIFKFVRYLKGTINFDLPYCGYSPLLKRYCDANWISDSNKLKRICGYVFTLAGWVISWKSSKQICIARFTMELELVALEKAETEDECLRSLLINWYAFIY